MAPALSLPIDALRSELEARLAPAPQPLPSLTPQAWPPPSRLVLSSPTGSGKSTQVPRWCMARGRVLVVEPRRVACRGLAARVAELEGVPLGDLVGYSVRDDNRASSRTRLLFATPGVVLQRLSGGDLERFDTIILDEFHERSLDVDLLLALLLERHAGTLIVMSATLDGERIATHLGGVHLHADGRQFPVERRYLPSEGHLPTPRGLEARLSAAVAASRELPGDILVFLPGKGEIARAGETLAQARAQDLEILPLHGGLTLEQQSRVFTPGQKRRVILATNVAETSITIPGIGVVIDSGLVRRTEYHDGRGFLSIVAIAGDSAEQRTGRAGRTAPGVCFRLWSLEARLTERTPPEVHRESLTPLMLAAAACGASSIDALPFLDLPKPYAIEAARLDLQGLGAIDGTDRITDRGRALFGLPLDPALGSLLVAAESLGCLEDAIDLVAVLSVGRPLFGRQGDGGRGDGGRGDVGRGDGGRGDGGRGDGGRGDGGLEDDLREGGCDAVASIRAVRIGRPGTHRLNAFVLEEARAISVRLREAWKLPRRTPTDAPIDRRRLARAALAADPRCAHVARSHGKQVGWSNGGTELELGQESAVSLLPKGAEAVLALGTHAIGLGFRERRILISCAMPVPMPWLLEAGLGRDRLAGMSLERGVIMARIERVYAQKVLSTREETPTGALAREAVAALFLEGRLFRKARETSAERLEAWALYGRLAARGLLDNLRGAAWSLEEARWPGGGAVPELEPWVQERVRVLGVESGEDVSMLSADDFLAPDLPEGIRRGLDQAFPRLFSIGDAQYRIQYDLAARHVTLEKVAGHRKDPPPLALLPGFHGMRVTLLDRGRAVVLRDRG